MLSINDYKVMKKICIGIDISKETFDATVLLVTEMNHLEQIAYSKYDNRPSGFRSLVAWVKKQCKTVKMRIDEDALFCMETTGSYDQRLCQYLYDKGLHVWREGALQIHLSSGFRRGKNDKADSLNIAEYAARHQDKLKEYEPDSQSVKELKELVNYRKSLVDRRKQCKTRISEKKATAVDTKSSTYKMIVESAKSEEKLLNELIDNCEKQMQVVIDNDESMSKHYKHITSIKGINIVNASAIIAYSGDFKKIRTAKEMFCYAGCAVFYLNSGTSVHKRDPNKNVCCKMLGTYLRLAAKSAITYNKTIKAYSQRLLSKGKNYGIVVKNIVSKLLHIIYSLVKNDCDFEYDYEEKRIKQQSLQTATA